MYALADCNNFYANCERIFEPSLTRRPIIVLSNNDGCVVARSQEAKLLGIQMGQPVFQCRDVIKANNIVVRSSNYALYEDMSRRVINSILHYVPDVEIYSIDEVFCDLNPMAGRDLDQLCRTIRKSVLQWTGVPISVGIGPTKTLAKLANRIAKKGSFVDSTYRFPNKDEDRKSVLSSCPVDEVWGIGSRWSKRLNGIGIRTALELSLARPEDIRRHLNATAMQTAIELSGIACQGIEDGGIQRKTLVRSCSFGKVVDQWWDMSQAIASHAVRAAEKLRGEGGAAGRISVFIQTNRFREDLRQHNASASARLLPSTSVTPVIVEEALRLGRQLWKPNYAYKKSGVMLSEMTFGQVQGSLFSDRNSEQDVRLMQVMDQINMKMGSGTLYPAAQGVDRSSWSMRRSHCSPRYTTRWEELPRTV